MNLKPTVGALAILESGTVLAQTPDSVVDPGPKPPHVDVCLMLPLSGPHAMLGERVADAVDGELRARDSEHTVMRLDTAGTLDGAVSAVTMALNLDCSIAIGGLGDREALAVANAAESAGVPTIVLGLAPDSFSRSYVVWARTPRDVPVKALAGYLIAVRGEARASLLHPDNAYGRKASRAFASAFQTLGGRIRVEQSYDPGSRDMKEVAERFSAVWKASGEGLACAAEVIFVVAGFQDTRRLLPFLRYDEVLGNATGGECPPITVAGTSMWNQPVLIAHSGDELQGALFADVEVNATLEEGGNRRLLDLEAADAACMALEFLESRKGPGFRDIMEIMRSGLDIKAHTGLLRIERGRLFGRKITVYEIDRGSINPVDGM